MEARLGERGLVILGVHTPEYEFERDRSRVERFAKKFKVAHPVYLDDDHAYWNAVGNQNWPAFYLIDRAGNIRGFAEGEMHADSNHANGVEALLVALLDESVAEAEAFEDRNDSD